MIQTRKIGDVSVTRVLEYAGPTHDPAFLFPDLPQAELDALAPQIAPHHYVPHMNKLVVTVQLWLVRTGAATILIDTGVGNLKPRGAARMNQLNGLALAWLEAAGAGREQVTHVLHTHLHMDHIGWNTILIDGRWEPTFPNARYLIPHADHAYYREALAKAPDPIIDGAFADSLDPVIAAGLAEFIEPGAGDLGGCLEARAAPGHSPGMLTFGLRSGGEEAIFSADVLHSPLQILKPDLNTAYCVLPEEARRTRAALLAEAADREALIMPMHFGAPHCGYVRRQGDGYRFEGGDWPALRTL